MRKRKGADAHEEPLDVAAYYYDGDFPPEGSQPIGDARQLGIEHDVQHLVALATRAAGPVLEVGAGTGRVTLALARASLDVVAVESSAAMVAQLRQKLAAEAASVRRRVRVVQRDATKLSLDRRDFALAMLPFGTLPCIADFHQQCAVIRAMAKHLAPGGELVIDTVNPLTLRAGGDPLPRAVLRRINPHNGRPYRRYTIVGPFDARQRQRVHGWYEEDLPDGTMLRRPYEIFFRPVFRFELELMAMHADLRVTRVDGDHLGTPFASDSPIIFLRAARVR